MPLSKIAACAAAVVLIAAAGGAEAGRYENARFAYVIEIPAAFSQVVEADNGDGGKARSADGDAELAVWGANLLDETFAEDVESRVASDTAGGWSVSYKSVRSAAASWSGSRGGRIAYTHAIAACEGQVAYFRVEYDRAALKAFDPVVKRLVRSLKPTGRCM